MKMLIETFQICMVYHIDVRNLMLYFMLFYVLLVLAFLCCSKPEVRVVDVTLVEREKELAEKEAQVCRTQQMLCPP